MGDNGGGEKGKRREREGMLGDKGGGEKEGIEKEERREGGR